MSSIDKSKIQNILIIKIAAIGDLLLTTPAVRVIRRQFPQAKITLLVGRWSRPIIEGNPYINEIIEVPDAVFFRFRPLSLLALISKLRRRHFDLVMVWHRSLAFRVFAWALGIKTRIGFSRNRHHEFLAHYVEENPGIHEIFEYQSTLMPLGIESSEIDMDLAISHDEIEFALQIWQNNKIQNNELVVAIAPGGAKNPKETVYLKHWPPDYYAQVAKKLMQNNSARIIFLGNQADHKLICQIQQHAGGGINLAGKTSLKQLAAIIQKCALFIGNDSAPMHIAAAVKTTTIAIFGPTNPLELAPLNYRHRYLFAGVPCSPCYSNGRFPDCKNQMCMQAITPAMVLSEIDQLLLNT